MSRTGLCPRVALAASALLVLTQAAALEEVAPLIDAIQQRDQATALALISNDSQNSNTAEITERTADGTTALHWAVRLGEERLVNALLAAGAPAGVANRYGMTPAHLAAVNGDVAVMRALLEAGADPNAALPEGETVLMTAARTGEPETIRVLLEHDAESHAREQWHGETAMIWAAAQNHGDAITVLAQYGTDVDLRSGAHEFENRRLGQSVLPLGEWTPLMYAAREGALDAGGALLSLGANPDILDPDGASALVIAIINAQYEFAALLIRAGADPNPVDNTGMGALYAAIDMHRLAAGHGRPNPRPSGTLDGTDVVRLLLSAGADPNAQLSRAIMQRQHTFGDFTLGEGATPLLRAAKSGDIAMLRLLLDSGADPAHTMPNGSNALMYAAGLGWRNGSPLAPSYDQGSPQEAIESLTLLLGHGLDINGRNDAGDTALHAAVAGRASEEIIRYLVTQTDADFFAKNANEQTPLEVALAKRSGEDLVVLLQELAPTDPEGSAAQ